MVLRLSRNGSAETDPILSAKRGRDMVKRLGNEMETAFILDGQVENFKKFKSEMSIPRMTPPPPARSLS